MFLINFKELQKKILIILEKFLTKIDENNLFKMQVLTLQIVRSIEIIIILVDIIIILIITMLLWSTILIILFH